MLFMIFPFWINDGFYNLEQSVHAAPRKKSKRTAMPEAADEKRKEQIEKMSPFRHSVTSCRNIDIIPEPCGERNVPAAPKFLNGKREIWTFKISH